MIISKDDTLIFEKYFRDYERDDLQIRYTITKNFGIDNWFWEEGLNDIKNTFGEF